MKINNTSSQTSFKSDLTYKLIKDFRHINIKNAESDFAKLGVNADFLDNKFICGSSILTADILHNIASKYKLPFDFLPPAIIAYDEANVASENAKDLYGFCIVDTRKVLKNKPLSIGCSIFFNNEKNPSLIKVKWQALIDKALKLQNTSHFLCTILHEWFHCIHQNLVFQKYGYEGNCPVLNEQYYQQDACGLDILKNKDILFDALLNHQEEVRTLISDYAAENCSKSEIFAELMTMITTKSLDKNLNPIKNPLDNIPKNLPKSIITMIEEILY